MTEPLLPAARRRRPWMVAPLALVLLLAVGWSAVWFYAAHRAEGAVAAWLTREAAAGRVHTCGTRTVGGYPFRIEMRCEDPRAEVHGFGRPLTLRAASLQAVAQVYEPDLVIAELAGPLTVASNDGALAYTLNWSLLQASLRGFPLAFQRASLVIDGLVVQRAGAAEDALLGAARHVELHARQRPGTAELVFDIAARAQAARLSAVRRLAEQPIDASVEAAVEGVKDLAPKPFETRLREWQANGGRLAITRARVQTGNVIAAAAGEVRLTAQARLDGGLQVTLAGLEDVATRLLGEGGGARNQASLLAGLAMLAGPAEVEGRRAVKLPLRLKDGALFLGPLPIAQTPALY